MKDHDTPRHPGPFQVMGMGGWSAAIMVVFSYVALGLVDLPVAKFFLLGAVLLGAGVAILLRISRGKRP